MCPLRYIILLLSVIIAGIGLMSYSDEPDVEQKNKKQQDSSLERALQAVYSLFSGQFLVQLFSLRIEAHKSRIE